MPGKQYFMTPENFQIEELIKEEARFLKIILTELRLKIKHQNIEMESFRSKKNDIINWKMWQTGLSKSPKGN